MVFKECLENNGDIYIWERVRAQAEAAFQNISV